MGHNPFAVHVGIETRIVVPDEFAVAHVLGCDAIVLEVNARVVARTIGALRGIRCTHPLVPRFVEINLSDPIVSGCLI